ncbi:MAG TPA: UDP-N-acetylmuramoyl-L-alanine--D-glutamate ligase [Actinophytocola sp.]|uniref:UDP-N-acetylmuramoyl-L-alanine--D-glutamate ligase n=1 Tax=Actinophytocola sp. TaxID=1872138 RepID=UPI002DDD6C91|nr:UDP-N-acetylmuramoyl-L-alanine--D-glutamate ligase [Actinophytocola sp.]HEV2781986.1 UDP-N-acetylmuramoyl-L-alanine--D-glutamate ligase [Actinophytocola sp.]
MFAGQRVLVTGAGVTGRSVAAALLGMGARVTVTDADPERLVGFDPAVTLVPGLAAVPDGTDLVVTSPGWGPTNPLLTAAAMAGVEVIGDVELAWRVARRPTWLAVTGTNGKTTTIGMLEAVLNAAGLDAVACGNVGLPVIDAVLAGHRVLAVELSSFQLHWQSSLRPKASVVLNVAEDHLDWHGSLDDYAAAKGKIYAGAEVAVFNADDVWSTLLSAGHGDRVGFTLDEPGDHRFGIVDGWLVDGDEQLAEVSDVPAPGLHNVANALAAAALARVLGVPAEAVRDGLRVFRPGDHRAVLVGEWNGVRYVNDSKATNPHAAASSLGAYSSVVWLVGGQLKGASIDDLVAEAVARLRGVVLMGADSDVISASLARHAPQVPTHRVGPGDDDPMMAAVRAASSMARPGDVVLLAPAAASFDMFRNYAKRGEAFAAAVKRLHGVA